MCMCCRHGEGRSVSRGDYFSLVLLMGASVIFLARVEVEGPELYGEEYFGDIVPGGAIFAEFARTCTDTFWDVIAFWLHFFRDNRSKLS